MILKDTAFSIELHNGKQLLVELAQSERKRIPSKGPFVAIANRAHPGTDDRLLTQIFKNTKGSFKFFAATDLKLSYRDRYESVKRSFSSNTQLFDQADVFRSVIAQDCSIGFCIDYLDNKPWRFPSRQALRFLFQAVKGLQVPIVPVHLEYQSTATQGHTADSVRIRIGLPISPADQQLLGPTDRFRRFVQSKIYALGSALEVHKFYRQPGRQGSHEALIDGVLPELLEADVQKLSFRHLISSQGNYDVFLAKTTEIPHIIKEIGRLRELTFRAVGEGTGKCFDLDEFDLYYEQLFIWDREARRVVGGYRMGRGDDIFHQYGVEGFYIFSLFKIKKPFFEVMRQSVELGRSFVVEDYQKKRLPLYLLWRGILYFLLRNPQYRYLYGPLSISKHYSEVSKSIIIAFVRKYYFDHQLADYLKPRKPFQLQLERMDIDVLLDQLQGQLGQLDQFIEDIEPNHFRIPILLKQYIRQNARFISFNVDPNFSDALDGFMILDLKDVPYSTIQALKKEAQ